MMGMAEKIDLNLFGEEEFLGPSLKSCPGCGATIMTRFALKALGKDTIVIIPASCLATLLATNTQTGIKIPYLHALFECGDSTATGVVHAMKWKGKENVKVVTIAGDSGSMDIGFQALSGAAIRNEDILHICYDNEVAMNTGGQLSSCTPFKAKTPDEPLGNRFFKKDGPSIMAAHNIPYVATASISHLEDFYMKVKKAKDIQGFRYIHVISPCPVAWKYDGRYTVEVARRAVESGMWMLYEIENGEFRLTYKPEKRIPVSEYIRMQGRFDGVSDEDVARIQEMVNEMWRRYEE